MTTRHEHHHDHVPRHGEGRIKDPVCGMDVDPSTTPHQVRHEGVDYHFCSSGCRDKFLASPGKYVSGTPAPSATPAPPGAMYTCPMHPQVRQPGPGTCPICGMALEPEMPTLDEEENPELRDFTRRFWWTLPLTVVVFVLGMFGERMPLPAATRSWIELACATPVVLWAGWPFFERCVQRSRFGFPPAHPPIWGSRACA